MQQLRSTLASMNFLAKLGWYIRLRRRLMGWNKADLINHLASVHGYSSYLEICNPISGYRYREINQKIFTLCNRMGYRSPTPLHADGLPYDFRTEGFDSSESIREIRARGLVYDVILVDSWHEYEISLRDLNDAMSLLSDRGTVVVHDCLPQREDFARLPYRGGIWSGVSFRAFLDFVVQRSLDYRTVDTDLGCGIIRKGIIAPPLTPERKVLLKQWAALGDDHAAAFRFLHRHKELWNVISVNDFLAEERQLAPSHLVAQPPNPIGHQIA